MLQLSWLRTNAEQVKQKLKVKHFLSIQLIDEIVIKDEAKRAAQTKLDYISQQLNNMASKIGQLIAQGKKDEAEYIKQEVTRLKAEQMLLHEETTQLNETIQKLLVELPNLPLDEVPNGKTSEDNEVVKQTPLPQIDNKTLLPHWDLVKKYDLIDFELGSKISGSGFPFYKNMGAVLQRKLIDYFLEFNRKAGYTEYQTPLLVNRESAFATGQLPDKEGQMYHVGEDDLYLIPTAEVTLTNIFRDTLLQQKDLPIKLTGHTACFRREAGSYGKDVRGLNRLHQFDKVEIVQIVEPQYSKTALDEMVHHVESLLSSLKLPYRILKLCGGDMGFASALTYDFEVYSLAQKRWLEVSSVSCFTTFQANRLKLRYKNADGKNDFPHTLNGSSLALPRIVASLLEFYQEDKGIRTPEVLIPYIQKEWLVND